MQNDELQALLLSVMPQWHYWIAKPFVKQVVTEEVSGGMFHCLQMLRANGEPMTMSEIARAVHCSKQQMTKTVGKLIDCGFAERVPDPADRRIIRLKLTSEGNAFIDRFQALCTDHCTHDTGGTAGILRCAENTSPHLHTPVSCGKCRPPSRVSFGNREERMILCSKNYWHLSGNISYRPV